ncbi:MAG: hypothetical protein KDA51_06000 [Planctomycetales bacterium]|nr:hypothetical protein [Planctomycetales bacterium]MCA9180983.1 hypothetical protein [Planctomycetales bacterium]
MLQLSPFLASIAAPVASKAAQVVAHAAHQTGQSFLKTFAQLGEQSANAARAIPDAHTLQSELESFSKQFHDWLGQQGVDSPYELQFHLAKNGDPIANVVGKDSEKIADLLYGDNNSWLQRLTSLASQASEESPLGPPGEVVNPSSLTVKLSISSEDAYVLSQPVHAN